MAGLKIAVVVGDHYHRPEPMLEAVEAAARACGLAAEPCDDPLKLPWERLGALHALVIARGNKIGPTDSAAVWATDAHASALADFVHAGGAVHAAIQGFQEIEMQDEMYFVRVDSARTTALLEVSSADYGTSCAAWAHEIGKGRVFCLTPGHTDEVLANPAYRRLLAQGLGWAAGAR